MHKFLEAVGFSELKKKDLEIIIKDIIDYPQMMRVTKDSDGNEFAELSKEFAPNIGITVRGTYDEEDVFHMEYYYPYFYGTEVTTREEIEIQKHAEKESYAGVCDDTHLGVTLIFYLQNLADYLSENNRANRATWLNGAILSGLSIEGKILLPVEQREDNRHPGKYTGAERSQLIAKAKDGDESAIESLTAEDMDIYNILSRRILHEDILTIVNSYFMPYGIESDQYSILGDILDYTLEINKITNERIYCMKLLCNDIIFDVCIPEKKLLGEPEIGRRFKGNIWMQVSICML